MGEILTGSDRGFKRIGGTLSVLWIGKDRECVQQIMVLRAAEICIRRKKLTVRSKDWWSSEIQAAIQARK